MHSYRSTSLQTQLSKRTPEYFSTVFLVVGTLTIVSRGSRQASVFPVDGGDTRTTFCREET